ncbi:hypothetical protein [Dactylosporangium sp. NPDC049140]|uniref:hypothetical protein n=1 Tax=Dactylosporangium sp. NPDC049140 TaxID=3155647 RepID=UPI0033C41CBA
MKTEFDTAMGVVPASPIDVDRLIVRGRRRALVRRLAGAGAGGGAAAVAVGVAVAFGAGGAPGGGAQMVGERPSVAPPSAAPASAAPRPVPAGTGSTPPGEARSTEARLAPVVRDVVRQKAPGYTLSAGADGPAFKMRYLYDPGNDSYYGSANLHGPTGEGNVAINVGRRSTQFNPMNPCTGAETGTCSDTTEADGTHILRRVIHENGIADNYVIVDRPDGITIFIVAANQGGQTDSSPGRQAEPVLPFETLVSIALDPRLTV